MCALHHVRYTRHGDDAVLVYWPWHPTAVASIKHFAMHLRTDGWSQSPRMVQLLHAGVVVNFDTVAQAPLLGRWVPHCRREGDLH